jgi:predicted membrane-bound mannosyltransferase
VLRFPSIVAGIAALVILPILASRIWGPSVGCVVAALLAVSPVVIFYSRIMRPYAPAMLLATSSVLLTLTMLWLKEGRRNALLLSALCVSLAIYYHLYTAIPIIINEGAPFTRAEMTLHLEKNGIETRTLFVSMPTQCPGFEYLGYRLGQFPNAEYMGLHGIHIGVHQDVGIEEMEYVLAVIGRFIDSSR